MNADHLSDKCSSIRDVRSVPGRFGGRAQSDRSLQVLRTGTLIVIAGVVAWLCWSLIAPFRSGITWGLTIAIVCAPIRKRLLRRMSRPAAASLLAALVIVLLAVLLTLAVQNLLQELAQIQASVSSWLQSDNWRHWLFTHPQVRSAWEWANREVDFGSAVQQVTGTAASLLAPAVAKSAGFFTQCGVTLLVLFFVTRDQEVFQAALKRALPLQKGEVEYFAGRISATIRSAVYGRLAVGLLQGMLGGLIFAIVGLPAPIFWGAIMVFFSILPVFGAPVVWVPACVILALTDHWIKGAIVASWGIAVIHPVDNILYPILVGETLGLHPLALFVAFVGGLIAFGPSGLILGPCIIAIAAGILDLWFDGFSQETNRVVESPAEHLSRPDFAAHVDRAAGKAVQGPSAGP